MASVGCLKDGRWYVSWMNPKWPAEKPRRLRQYLGRGAAAETLAYHRKTELEYSVSRKPRTELTFSHLANEYLKSRTTMPDKGIVNLFYRFENVIGPHLGDLPISELTHSRLDQYRRDRKTEVRKSKNSRTGYVQTWKSPSPITIHDELTDIMTVLNYAAYYHKPSPLIDENPLRGYKKGKRPTNPNLPPTITETRKILRFAAPHLFRAILLDLYCGYRPGPSELLTATWDHVDFTGNTLLVVSAHKGGLDRRHIALGEEIKTYLLGWHNEDIKSGDTHIIHYNGKPIASLKRAWTRAKERAGVKRRMRLYDLRHAFATNMLEAGADLKSVSLLLGHASPEITMRAYQHVSDKLKASAIGTLPSIGSIDSVFGSTGTTKGQPEEPKKVVNIAR